MAAESGISSGYGDGKFGTEDAIIREQMVVIRRNYAKRKGYDINVLEDGNFASVHDDSSVSPWACEALSWATSQGLISGDIECNIDPNGSATRGQVAGILMWFCKYYVN